jgi:hypothetical protein
VPIDFHGVLADALDVPILFFVAPVNHRVLLRNFHPIPDLEIRIEHVLVRLSRLPRRRTAAADNAVNVARSDQTAPQITPDQTLQDS